MSFRVRCRYCRRLLFATTDQLGEREARTIRAHVAGCCPNVGPLPHAIGDLLQHLSVTIAVPDDASVRLLTTVAAAARTVLVVHDDPATRTTLAARLVDGGYAVTTASDAVDALRWLHADLSPCAILLDLALPRVNGLTLASWLAHHPRYVAIAVIGLERLHASMPRRPPRGVAELLPLPADERALVAVVDRHCTPG